MFGDVTGHRYRSIVQKTGLGFFLNCNRFGLIIFSIVTLSVTFVTLDAVLLEKNKKII